MVRLSGQLDNSGTTSSPFSTGLEPGSINELRMVPDSGRSGYPVTISYTINNTDQFVGFQFDIILPPVITYITDSVWLFRKTNHLVIANLVNSQTLRILAFSPTNAPFLGSNGEIVAVKFNLNGPAGTYNVGLSNVVISNAGGTNILTGFYPGEIKIISPDIAGQAFVNFGEVSVLDTLTFNYQLNNTGNDTLIVTEISSLETYFWNATALPQNVLPGGSKSFELKFHNLIKGTYSTTYTIRSNDPDEDPFLIEAAALSFAPNYILIQNEDAYLEDTVTLRIDVDNYEQFIDFQVDLEFPASMNYITNSAALTSRTQDHVLFEIPLTSNKIRLFTFSANQLPFNGNSGTVATLNFFAAGPDTGIFPLDLSGGILLDSDEQNIIRSTIDGEIHLRERPRFQVTVNIANGWNMVSIPGLHPVNQNVNTWWAFRDMSADVFRFSGTYQSVSIASPGTGYWMKHSGPRTYNTGDEWPAVGIQVADHNPIPGALGWNLIGGYELSVPVENITTIPPDLQSGIIYKYSGGYQPAVSLDPGYGYWMKLTGAGLIIIPEIFVKAKTPIEYFPEDWGRIIFTDASGVSYALYFVKGVVDLTLYELPPAPLEGMFDIRFESGRIAEDISNFMKIIEIRGISYPVKVKAVNIDIRLQDETGLKLNKDLKNADEIIINDPSITALKVTGESVPIKFALEQNYPNPFNPRTNIEFRIPNFEFVSLKVYDLLGKEVATLVNEEMDAGSYEIEFNPKGLSSGIYFYKLQAGSFVETKKMILLR
jgi:hypothetical protein